MSLKRNIHPPILSGVLIFTLYILMFSTQGAKEDISSLFLSVHGGLYMTFDLYPFVVVVLPFVVQIALYGFHMVSDYSTVTVYAFTRTLSKTRWYCQKFLRIVFYSFFFCNAGYIITLLLGVTLGYGISSWTQIFALFLYLNVTSCVVNIVILTTVNVLSLYVSVKACLLFSVASLALSTALSMGRVPALYRINPVFHSYLLRHDISWHPSMPPAFSEYAIEGFSPWLTLISSAFLLCVVFITGLLRMQHKRDVF